MRIVQVIDSGRRVLTIRRGARDDVPYVEGFIGAAKNQKVRVHLDDARARWSPLR